MADASQYVKFRDTDGDEIELKLTNGQVSMYVNSTLQHANVNDFEINLSNRNYRDDSGYGTISPSEDIHQIKLKVDAMLAAASTSAGSFTDANSTRSGDTGPVVLPSRAQLATLAKEQLLELLEKVRRRGSEAALPEPPPLVRTTTAEELQCWSQIEGDWEDDMRAINVGGNQEYPKVTFTSNRLRHMRRMSVSGERLEITRLPSGEPSASLHFQVVFPPDESNSAGLAMWTLHSTGEVDIMVAGETTRYQMRRPLPRFKVREQSSRRFGGGFAARMTEPSSKALGLFEEFPPYKLDNDEGLPWCLPVLRTEAQLRLQDVYLSKVGSFFDNGLVPPVDICEEVETQALQKHGYEGDHWIPAYRFAARMLPKEARQEIFFLHANDKLFRPQVQLLNQALQGEVINADHCGVKLEEVLRHPRMLLIASTAT